MGEAPFAPPFVMSKGDVEFMLLRCTLGSCCCCCILFSAACDSFLAASLALRVA